MQRLPVDKPYKPLSQRISKDNTKQNIEEMKTKHRYRAIWLPERKHTRSAILHKDIDAKNWVPWKHTCVLYRLPGQSHKVISMPEIMSYWRSGSTSLCQYLLQLRNQTVTVKTDDDVTETISIEGGVRQGCVLSPLLFNLLFSSWPCLEEQTALRKERRT